MADDDTTLVRHYKGGIYRLVGEAVHSETGEDLVLYQAVDGGRIWARPRKMFYGTVSVDGHRRPRFEPA